MISLQSELNELSKNSGQHEKNKIILQKFKQNIKNINDPLTKFTSKHININTGTNTD